MNDGCARFVGPRTVTTSSLGRVRVVRNPLDVMARLTEVVGRNGTWLESVCKKNLKWVVEGRPWGVEPPAVGDKPTGDSLSRGLGCQIGAVGLSRGLGLRRGLMARLG
ncbi:hypothetical protein CRG98_011094 [Punica granatum]|uniref:Uncharacterized protein n=1 Tax=Punica granatum TaxID=22663 RepID=A0A2I0KJ19_PUNGR|nr:hypothetical protein CRG98_011094 [Punica granatum]